MRRCPRVLVLAAVCLASLGCKDPTEKACEKTWDHVGPIFGDPDDYASETSYANMFQAAFMEACPDSLSNEERSCLEGISKRKQLREDCESAWKKIAKKQDEIRKARDAEANKNK